jgi:hypothetical protein
VVADGAQAARIGTPVMNSMDTAQIVLAAIALVVLIVMVVRQRMTAKHSAGMMRGLREQALTEEAGEVGITPDPGKPWGVLMETTYGEVVMSVVVFADGSASLYFSSGGGFLGGGENPSVNQAARALVAKAATEVQHFEPATDHAPPADGMTRFYLRTDGGLLTAEAAEEDLGENRHVLSALFHTGHEVLTQIRLISEQQS